VQGKLMVWRRGRSKGEKQNGEELEEKH